MTKLTGLLSTTIALWVLMAVAVFTGHRVGLDTLSLPSAYPLGVVLFIWHLSSRRRRCALRLADTGSARRARSASRWTPP